MATSWLPGRLELVPALDCDLLAGPVSAALRRWADTDPDVEQVMAAPVDPALSDTAAFCQAYDVPPAASANCVVVTGKREGEPRWGAAVVLATTRADVNGALRRRLDVRKLSFAATAEAVERTGMEFGGITPVGLPADWPVFVDAAVVAAGAVVVGAGIRSAKLVLPGSLLGRLPGAVVVPELARAV